MQEGSLGSFGCCRAESCQGTGQVMHNMEWEAERTTVTDTETLTAALAAAPQLLEAAAYKQPHHVQALPNYSPMLLAHIGYSKAPNITGMA